MHEFDEQFRLIMASNIHEAFVKARFVGVKNECSLETESGETVSWQFVDVAFIRLLENFSDGMELFTHTHEAADPHDYIRFVQRKAENIYSGIQPIAAASEA